MEPDYDDGQYIWYKKFKTSRIDGTSLDLLDVNIFNKLTGGELHVLEDTGFSYRDYNSREEAMIDLKQAEQKKIVTIIDGGP